LAALTNGGEGHWKFPELVAKARILSKRFLQIVLVSGVNRSFTGVGLRVSYLKFRVGSEGPRGIWTRMNPGAGRGADLYVHRQVRIELPFFGGKQHSFNLHIKNLIVRKPEITNAVCQQLHIGPGCDWRSKRATNALITPSQIL
jgi:hypothetical protein